MSPVKIAKTITSSITDFYRRAKAWWGGVGCRVSFFVAVALTLVAVMIGAFFFWEGKKTLEVEIRGRALYLARELSALAVDDIITGNRLEIYRRLEPAFSANDDEPSSSDLLFIMVYKHNGDILIGSSESEVFFNSDSYFYTLPSGDRVVLDDIALDREAMQSRSPFFLVKKDRIYDLTLPVMAGIERVGFVRVGISGQRYAQKFAELIKKSFLVLFGSLLVGMIFSRIIAGGITNPISRLSEAAEKLSNQNWETPIQVTGKDEISKLGAAFNRMAATLKQREASLSRGNRDLFILHTAGLDLMESLDLDTLLPKIAGRSEDLVRADTLALSAVNSSEKALKYIGVFGSKTNALKNMSMPVEAGGIYNWLVSYGTPLLIQDAQSDFRLDRDEMASLGIRCMMTVPLWSSNKMIGLISAINKKGNVGFDKHDLRLFTVFSNLAGVAVQNASLYADLRGKIAELKQTHEQLVRSAKMAAIGELAANVAHEINNPLTSVLGYASHLLRTHELTEQSRHKLAMMEQETLRVRKIIRNLLDFSRQRPSWMKPTDIIMPLRDTVAFVQGAAESSLVRIHEEYDSKPVVVNMDANEMKQVFINIINNAIQAMPHGGDLRIRVNADMQAGQAEIEFRDTGVGIPKENIGKIFEPFFSTKGEGDGTGLGLSISYRIVQNHKGRIEVESEADKGSLFRILLPLHQGASDRPALQTGSI